VQLAGQRRVLAVCHGDEATGVAPPTRRRKFKEFNGSRVAESAQHRDPTGP